VIETSEIFIDSIDFAKSGGLVPTVVCDAHSGVVRMLAYSSRESLRIALQEHAGVYWSRTAEALWRKGDSSGNVQRLITAACDCDRDALIFYVEQTGPTCHLDDETCFAGPTPFSWSTLAKRIEARVADHGSGSYTRALLTDPVQLAAKVLEEAAELVEAQTADDVAWECADLLYFITVKMQATGIGIADVMAELERRAK
jgi:phosphoribosyl-ATP pyrophosphohydrolase